MKKFGFIFLVVISQLVSAQTDSCTLYFEKWALESEHVQAKREYWVALPPKFDPKKQYPVLYVLDAETRFSTVQLLMVDRFLTKKGKPHIVVGIPNASWVQRSIDFTYGTSTVRPDGGKMPKNRNNKTITGGADAFFQFINTELMPTIDRKYSTSGHNTLIGHSYGGLFATYVLLKAHRFQQFIILDPSAWYNQGEICAKLKNDFTVAKAFDVFVAYHTDTKYHCGKVEDLVSVLRKFSTVTLSVKSYPKENHSSMYLPALLDAISHLR